MLAYYFWTAMLAPGGAPRIHGRETDHFNLLSRGFKKGQLHLDGEVPAGLLAARNPYDPAARGNVEVLHDASYFQGRYYIYFGPAPVVTLLLPFSLIVGRDLPLPYAVWWFSSVGYLALVALFFFVQRRYFPRARPWSIAAAVIALGGASMVVALLRRPHIWELPAACGFAFFALSMLCLIRALHSPRATLWAALGGLALGTAVAARPTYLLCSVIFALPVVLRWKLWERACSHSHGDAYGWRALLAAAAGCSAIVAALLAYNYARFGNPLEFGQKYQLSAIIEGDARHFSLEYAWFNLRVYFLSALRWWPEFPFHHGIAVPPIPPQYGGYEYAIGLWPNLPFSLFGFVALGGLLIPSLRREARDGLWLALAAIATAAALNTGVLLCYFGTCIRYMVDFTPWFMLLAGVGLLELESRRSSSRARTAVGACGLLAAVFSSVVAALSVVNFYDKVPGQPPLPYRPVARALNRPIFELQQRRWPDYGPVEIALSLPAARPNGQETLVAVTRGPRETAAVLVDYLDGGQIRLGYREPPRAPGKAASVIFSPAIAVPADARTTLRLSIGGPYSDYDGYKGRLRAQVDGRPLWDAQVVSFGAYPGQLHVGPEVAAGPAAPRFSGVVHSARPTTMPELPRAELGGVRVRLTFAPSMAGRALPLITTGRIKAGDFLFIRVHADHKVTFGYDHWGHPLLTSPEIPARLGEPHVVEFWIPAVTPPGREPTLIVKLDGAVVWQQAAAGFPVAPETVFLGSNPIGGSTCELALEHGVFEDAQLPPPRAEN